MNLSLCCLYTSLLILGGLSLEYHDGKLVITLICGDEFCSEQASIAKAKSIMSYNSKKPSHLSFKRGDIILIYGKFNVAPYDKFWEGAVVGEPGTRGVFPKSVVKEFETAELDLRPVQVYADQYFNTPTQHNRQPATADSDPPNDGDAQATEKQAEANDEGQTNPDQLHGKKEREASSELNAQLSEREASSELNAQLSEREASSELNAHAQFSSEKSETSDERSETADADLEPNNKQSDANAGQLDSDGKISETSVEETDPKNEEMETNTVNSSENIKHSLKEGMNNTRDTPETLTAKSADDAEQRSTDSEQAAVHALRYGSESPAVRGSESPAVRGSESPAVRGSESSAVRGSESAAVRGSESPVVRGSESPAVRGSESPGNLS